MSLESHDITKHEPPSGGFRTSGGAPAGWVWAIRTMEWLNMSIGDQTLRRRVSRSDLRYIDGGESTGARPPTRMAPGRRIVPMGVLSPDCRGSRTPSRRIAQLPDPGVSKPGGTLPGGVIGPEQQNRGVPDTASIRRMALAGGPRKPVTPQYQSAPFPLWKRGFLTMMQ